MLPDWLAASGLENYSLIVASISGCLDALRRRHAEIALVPHFDDEGPLPGLETQEIGEDRLSLVAAPAAKRRVTLKDGRLAGPIMVYAPGTNYGARIAALLARKGVAVAAPPLCESASAEALLAQARAGLGAAWLPGLLLRGEKLVRCDVPEDFDLSYKILLVRLG